MDTPGFAPAEPAGHEAGFRSAPSDAPHALAIRFTGSGSEYFRIWIVNLLLTIATLSLYYPWAKARRLRYFHGNTLVGGHPLGFHGDARAMLRGYLFGVLLLVAYSASSHVLGPAGALVALAIAALWPALLQSSLVFRFANTSWRGLRFRFRGSVGGAYRALLPPVLAAFGAFAVVGLLIVFSPVVAAFAMFAVMLAIVFGLMPWTTFRLKRYQHDHYAFGAEQTRLHLGLRPFVGLSLRTLGIGIVASVVMGVVVSASVVASGIAGRGPRPEQFPLASLIPMAVGLIAFQGLLRPYVTARMQNLVWPATASAAVSFTSALRFRALAGLSLKNWLLIVVTLGLYWPFAAVAMHRMRVESIGVVSTVDPDRFADHERRRAAEATGEAADDMLGIDVGL